MKLFKSLFMSALLLTASFLGAVDAPTLPPTHYSRTIVVSKQNYPYVSANPVDPHHAAMRGTGIFTEDQITQLDISSITNLFAQYGVDMSSNNPSVIVDPLTGIRTLPGVAIMLPSQFGTVLNEPWYVTTDTKNPEREFKWVQYEFSSLTLFLSNFVVPAGPIQAGANVIAGSQYFYTYIVQADPGTDLSKEKNREVFINFATQLGVQTVNMWGKPEFLITYPIFDMCYREGFGLSSTVEVNIPPNATGLTYLQGRIVLTWDGEVHHHHHHHCNQE